MNASGSFRTLLFLLYAWDVGLKPFRWHKDRSRLFSPLPACAGKLGDAEPTPVIGDQAPAFFLKCAPPRHTFPAGIKRVFQI